MSLDELRSEIADIDRALVELMAQRTYVAETIARVKEEKDLPTADPTQEARVVERAAENAERFDLEPETVQSVFELLIELSKETQRANR